jgi:hypothetical protein
MTVDGGGTVSPGGDAPSEMEQLGHIDENSDNSVTSSIESLLLASNDQLDDDLDDDVPHSKVSPLVYPWKKTLKILNNMGIVPKAHAPKSKSLKLAKKNKGLSRQNVRQLQQTRKESEEHSGDPPDDDDEGDDGEFRKLMQTLNQVPITIPHGFQISRTYLQPHPTVRDILHMPVSNNKDSFAILDNHFVHVIRDVGHPIVMPISTDKKDAKSPVNGLSRWIFVKKWRVIIIATLQLELKVSLQTYLLSEVELKCAERY